MNTLANTFRDELVLSHLELAQRMAQIMHRTTLSHVDLEDLESDAYLGLLEAAGQFDPARNVRFRTYAAKRIHGQMIDGLRERLRLRRRSAPLRMQSLDASIAGEDDQCLADLIPSRDPPVGSGLEIREEFDAARRMVDELSSVRGAHERGLSNKAVAVALGVTASAMSQRIKRFRSLVAQMDVSRN